MKRLLLILSLLFSFTCFGQGEPDEPCSTNYGAITITYSITATSGSNGTVSPSGTTTVSAGATQVYTITPSSGYYTSSITVDGSSVSVATTYTFSSVSANHTISASFNPVLQWSTTYHGSNVTISGTNNNTYTNSTGTANSGLGTIGENASGDHLFEVHVTFIGALTLVGVGTLSTNTGGYAGSDANAWVYDTYGTGAMYHAASPTALIGCSGSSGYYIVIEVDAGKEFVYLNGSVCNGGTAIATGLSGTLYPIMGYLNDIGVINGDATNFHYPISGKNTSAYSWQ